jgi:hypothetical protein
MNTTAAEKAAVLAHYTAMAAQAQAEIDAPSEHEVIAAKIAELAAILRAATWADSDQALTFVERAQIAWDCTYAEGA